MGTALDRITLLGLTVAVLTGCGASEERGSGEPPPATRVASTRGSAVVLSRDERVAVVANRSAGVVSVFPLDPEHPSQLQEDARTEIDLGEGSEPWASVIGADDDTAYVISRRDQRVDRLLGLHQNPHLDPGEPVSVGSEPTAIAIAPSGGRIFVANWGEGTISVVSTYEFARAQRSISTPRSPAVSCSAPVPWRDLHWPIPAH